MKKKNLLTTALVLMSAFSLTACGKDNKSSSDNDETPTPEATVEATPEPTKPAEITEGDDLNFDGYEMVWSDEFDADKLNRDDWNVELHDPGWVNNELQAYVDSENNIYIEDGKLVIKPEKNGSGYTSGRVNTQGKNDFKYGIFEASIKMPEGQGFLPAFWLMSSDENIYGQWPRCGEIDIAEVLGNETNKTYGTIHYGNPHKENQGNYILPSGDFASDFHKYAVEWLPGKITWYVDGVEIYSTSDWYSKTEDVGTITYPAPFDQPFYVILNLAVGGNWPGNPDDTTDIENASMQIDYVRVYQMDEYDENVELDEGEVVLRDPDENGNLIVNPTFDEEALDDEEGWSFLTAAGGEGSAELKDNVLHISTTKDGTEAYAIQVVQPDIPFVKGAEYELSFKAYASEERKMVVAVTAPNAGWVRYYQDTEYELTTEAKDFVIPFTMTATTDPTGRLEFNLGNIGSTADVYISDVYIKVVKMPEGVVEEHTVLGDGNYVYNSKFQEGKNHVGFWSLEGDGEFLVTPFEDGRKLHITSKGDAKVSQADLALSAGNQYALTFEAAGAGKLVVTINNQENTFELTDTMTEYSVKFTAEEKADFNKLTFVFPEGEGYLDNVKLVEDVMIKNGSFSAGLSGYEIYVDSSASAKYVVDSLSEDSAIDFTINNTGDQDWKIQLKQNDVCLEKGKKYKLSFDAKCDKKRTIRAIMQAKENKGWAVYSEDFMPELSEEYQTFTVEFTMNEETDPEAFLSICLGAVGGESISETHRVCIDNISLVEI